MVSRNLHPFRDETLQEPSSKKTCVFSPDERYVIVDSKEVIKLPSRQRVEFSGTLLLAYPGVGFMVGIFNSWSNWFRVVVFSSFNWTSIAQFDVDSIPDCSPTGRYVVLTRRETYNGVTYHNRVRFFDLFCVPSMKLWMLLLSLLHAKAPSVNKGCYHPVVFCHVFKYFTPYSLHPSFF